jgi:SH3-like domain-containing protein
MMRHRLFHLSISALFLALLVIGCGGTTVEATATPGPSLANILSEQLNQTPTSKPAEVITVVVTATNTLASPTTAQEGSPVTEDVTPTITATATVTELPLPPTATATEEGVFTQTPNTIKLRPTVPTINIRRGPSVAFAIVGYLSGDAEAQILARDTTGTWFNILTENGLRGWVSASVTEIVSGELNQIEVAATIPATPTPTRTPTPMRTSIPLPPPPTGADRTREPQPPPAPSRTPIPYPNPSPTSAAFPTPTTNPYP